MTILSVLGICAALAVLLFLVVHSLGATMLLVIFPAIIAGNITGERGLFSPNGNGGPSSIAFNVFLVFFLLLEVALVAALFSGIYLLFFGWPVSEVIQKETVLSVSQITNLLLINKILFAVECFFVVMFTYNSFKNRESLKNIKGIAYFQFRILPILSFPLGFIMLYGGYQYLSAYPNLEIGVFFKIAAYLYIIYLMYSLGKTIYTFTIISKSGVSQLKPMYWFMMVLGLAYNSGCFYYFFKVDFMF